MERVLNVASGHRGRGEDVRLIVELHLLIEEDVMEEEDRASVIEGFGPVTNGRENLAL